jgi:hypothetical protein
MISKTNMKSNNIFKDVSEIINSDLLTNQEFLTEVITNIKKELLENKIMTEEDIEKIQISGTFNTIENALKTKLSNSIVDSLIAEINVDGPSDITEKVNNYLNKN